MLRLLTLRSIYKRVVTPYPLRAKRRSILTLKRVVVRTNS